MNTRTHIRGRITSGPEPDDDLDRPFAVFLLENEQMGSYQGGRREIQVVEWCEVVCTGDLALNVLDSLQIGDAVSVWGELRVVRSRTEENDARVQLWVLADTVGIDLAYGAACIRRRAEV